MLEAHISDVNIQTNSYYTFCFTNEIYQYVLGVTEFNLVGERESTDPIQELSISVREVARGTKSLTIQPILHVLKDATADVSAEAYVQVTVLAVTSTSTDVQLNAGLGVQDGQSVAIPVRTTDSIATRIPILSAFSFCGGAASEIYDMTLTPTLGEPISGAVDVNSKATLSKNMDTRSLDVGLVLAVNADNGNGDPILGSYQAPRLQNSSSTIPTSPPYNNYVAFLTGLTLVCDRTLDFISLSASTSISDGEVSGYVKYSGEYKDGGEWHSDNQDNNKSGVSVVVFSWN